MPTASPFKTRLRKFGDLLARSPRLVVGGLVLAMVVLGLLIARNSQAQLEARSRAQSEGDALLTINQLGITLLDLETGQRGYILTKDPSYLAPYSAARKRVTPEFEGVKLAMMGSSSTADEAHLRAFGDLLRSKLAELDHTVSLARSGEFDLAATIVQTNLGKRDMDAMRLHLGALATHQSARRIEAFDRARAVGGNLLPLILVLWLLIVLFGWASVVGERRRAATNARAEQAEELREAHARVQLLAEELDHRVKNLFAVVLSIVKLSGRKQAPAEVLVADIAARVHALMQAHDAALANGGMAADLGEIAERTLAPYRDGAEVAVTLEGPAVSLSARNVTPIALILHELATNAAKYGALSQSGGALALHWTCAPDAAGGQVVTLQWREQGGPPVGEEARQPGSGFGTRMTGMAASQLGGEIKREWPDEGALVTLTFPQV